MSPSTLPVSLLDAKARVRERLRGDPRLVGVGVGDVDGRLGIVVYGTMHALDFQRVGDVPVVLRRAEPPVPLEARGAAGVNGVTLALGLVGLSAAASLAASRAGSRDTSDTSPPYTWNYKHVVAERGTYRIVVDDLDSATYVTLWTADNVRVGALSTRGMGHEGTLSIGSIEIAPSARAKGLALPMYRALLAHMAQRWMGISSYLPDQANKKQIPKIWRRLGGHSPPDEADWIVADRPIKGTRNVDARHDPQTDTPAFRAWFKNSRVVDPDTGRPRVVYHGTTHDFDAFDLKNANVENHHGRAFYFTTEREDVGSNYATRTGPDLTSRVENAMDNLSEADDQDALVDAWAKAHPGRKKDAATLRRSMTNGTVSNHRSVGYFLVREVWRWHAERRLVGSHGGAVLPVYLSVQDPVDLRSNWQSARAGHATGGTYFGIDTKWVREGRLDEQVRQTGLGVKAQKAIREVAARYWDRDLAEEILNDLDTLEGFSARELESTVRGKGRDWMSDDGDPGGPGEFLRQVYERMGFDGIVEDAYMAFGGKRGTGKAMAGVEPGTEHWVAFKPSQIKSAIGNRGTFSARSPKLSANRGAP